MADYRCPNCSGYGGHDDQCPSGGLVPVTVRAYYNAVSENIGDYWRRQRLRGLPYTLSGVQDAIDKAFGYGEDT